MAIESGSTDRPPKEVDRGAQASGRDRTADDFARHEPLKRAEKLAIRKSFLICCE